MITEREGGREGAREAGEGVSQKTQMEPTTRDTMGLNLYTELKE